MQFQSLSSGLIFMPASLFFVTLVYISDMTTNTAGFSIQIVELINQMQQKIFTFQ